MNCGDTGWRPTMRAGSERYLRRNASVEAEAIANELARFSVDHVFPGKFRQRPLLRFPTRWPLSYDVARHVTARRQLGETKDAFS